ncbi:hypothetical protein ACFE04_002383 [Oxalis oulophora]
MSSDHHNNFSIPSPLVTFSSHQEQNTNTNPNPNNINPSTTTKKKRNLPGTPDPDAEVMALSPKSLMATNRFICEICNKGFQRDQNLQLHRRGHNLPWKLRQRSNKEVIRKKVYICPVKTCVHHDPSRALGDLTGIKKHYSRKHCEKKWKCDKCSKKYAVQSDWKAHSKTCGTREYKCDCGTLFSRKDSFITHRAFCDALIEESARINNNPTGVTNLNFTSQRPHDQLVHQQNVTGISQFGSPFVNQDLNAITNVNQHNIHHHHQQKTRLSLSLKQSNSQLINTEDLANIYASSSNSPPNLQPDQIFGSSSMSSINLNRHNEQLPEPIIPMSATALLQKAAHMGSTRSSQSSFFGSTFGMMNANSTSFNFLN